MTRRWGGERDMTGIRDRLPLLREETLKDLPLHREALADLDRNAKGHFISVVAADFRFLAFTSYLLEGDVAAFRSGISDATRLKFTLVTRFEAGEPIPSTSYLSMLRYRDLLDVLATGDMDTARELSRLTGGRPEIEKGLCRPVDTAFGYALKGVIEGLPDTDLWLDRFEKHCQTKQDSSFAGYASALRAIAEGSPDTDAKFDEVVTSHKRLAKGLFSDIEDELLSVWGIGLANLARDRGLVVNPRNPLIPEDLLI